MRSSDQLGLYWGPDSFSIVENINGQISNIFQIPFDTPISDDKEAAVPNELRFPTLIQQALEFRLVKAKTVNVCIPGTELIFRSFNIPMMEKTDIPNVIEFEVAKYIPIKLDDLTYTYHTAPHVENNQKQLKVLFLAIRKTHLSEIASVIEKAGLTLQNIEAASISLLHLLKRHNILQKDKIIALLQIENDFSELVVFENEILYFMRKLNVSLNNTTIASLLNTLQNEVEISFNFYNRQNPSGKINSLVILAQHKIPGVIESLKKELGIPVSLIPIDQFIPLEEFQTNAHAAALGSTLRKQTFSSKFLDLSQRAIEMQRSGKDPLALLKRYGIMSGVITGCLIAVFLTVLIGNHMVKKNTSAITDLKQQLGRYEVMTAADIVTDKQKTIDKLNAYTSIASSSRFSVILMEIPKILPEGMWLTGFQISSSHQIIPQTGTEKLTITLNGKIYSPDPNEQFKILNDFISALKNHSPINNFYTEVKRESANRIIEDNYTITTFSITAS